MEKNTLGQKVREERLKKGYSQNALAKKAHICGEYLSEIERGIKMPSINSFISIIEALDISADYILRNELTAGEPYVCSEVTERLQKLSPKQRKTAVDILDAYITSLEE